MAEKKSDQTEKKLSDDDVGLLGGAFRGIAASLRSSLPAIKSSVRYVFDAFLIEKIFFLRHSLFNVCVSEYISTYLTTTTLDVFLTFSPLEIESFTFSHRR